MEPRRGGRTSLPKRVSVRRCLKGWGISRSSAREKEGSGGEPKDGFEGGSMFGVVQQRESCEGLAWSR